MCRSFPITALYRPATHLLQPDEPEVMLLLDPALPEGEVGGGIIQLRQHPAEGDLGQLQSCKPHLGQGCLLQVG